MFLILTRPAAPEMPYWPGRRLLAAADAVAWPALWVAAVYAAPMKTGAVGSVVIAVAALFAVLRLWKAVAENGRYRFTTWRWGKVVAALLLVGGVMKLSIALTGQ